MAITKYNIIISSNSNYTTLGAHNSNNMSNTILSTSSTLQKEHRHGDGIERGKACGQCR